MPINRAYSAPFSKSNGGNTPAVPFAWTSIIGSRGTVMRLLALGVTLALVQIAWAQDAAGPSAPRATLGAPTVFAITAQTPPQRTSDVYTPLSPIPYGQTAMPSTFPDLNGGSCDDGHYYPSHHGGIRGFLCRFLAAYREEFCPKKDKKDNE